MPVRHAPAFRQLHQGHQGQRDDGDQDDLQWYRAENKENGMWVYNVDLRRHNSVGNYAIHVYTGITEPETRIATYVVYVSHLPDDG